MNESGSTSLIPVVRCRENFFKNTAGHVILIAKNGVMKGVQSLIIGNAGDGAIFKEKIEYIVIAFDDGEDDRCYPIFSAYVGVDFYLSNQVLDEFQISSFDGIEEVV